MPKHGDIGTYRTSSLKQFHRHATEFAGRHILPELDTAEQMLAPVPTTVGMRLRRACLVA